MVDPKLIEERREITKLRAERDRLRSQAAVIRRDYDAACSKALALYQPHTKPHATLSHSGIVPAADSTPLRRTSPAPVMGSNPGTPDPSAGFLGFGPKS